MPATRSGKCWVPNLERTKNPWMILQDVSQDRLEHMVHDSRFRQTIDRFVSERGAYLCDPGWFGRQYPDAGSKKTAYFSMEFGLGEALPLYAGGLGILAAIISRRPATWAFRWLASACSTRKAISASPLDSEGNQLEFYPYNDPTSLPIQPVLSESGNWLHVELHLPGRVLHAHLAGSRRSDVALSTRRQRSL